MAQGYINPQLLAVLAAQGIAPPGVSQQAPPAPSPQLADPLAPLPPPPGGDPRIDPLAALAAATPPEQEGGGPPPSTMPPMDSSNQGINSVGRPADESEANEKELKKLKRQSKGEALLALGAGLLSANNFGEGISKGLQGYMAVMRDARTRFRPKHEDVAGGAFDKVTDPVTGEVTYKRTPVADYMENKVQVLQDGKLQVAGIGYNRGVDVARITADAGIEKTGMTTSAQRDIAQGNNATSVQVANIRSDSAATVARINGSFKGAGRNPNKIEQAAMERARMSPIKMERYDRIESLLDGGDSGAGAGFFNKLKRGAAEVTGMDIGGIDVGHMQQLETEFSTIQLEAAQLLQGQGQVSDAERRILAASVPTMRTDPAAVKSILNILRAVTSRDANGINMGSDGNVNVLAPPEPNTTSSGVKWRVVP